MTDSNEPQTGDLGLVETQTIRVFDEPMVLESGVRLGPVDVAYETYGALTPERDNVILVCHALSGGAHAAGWLPGANKPGWWDVFIGPGKALDTDRYYIVCSNVLGSCYGTTGPSSIDPATGRPYGPRFPVVTIADMVQVQARLLELLGIDSVLATIGGSMGGMQALQWGVQFPEKVRSVIGIATTSHHSAQQIAFNEVARQAIMADPAWNGGDYYGTEGPRLGLAVARMIGHITYLSDFGMAQKFGRRLRNREKFGFDFSLDFEVESYLRHQGESFVGRFDANSLLYLTKALDYFDMTIGGTRSLEEAFKGCPARFLLIAFSSDWLYPAYQSKAVAHAVRRNQGDATYCEIRSDYGHDAFLLEYQEQAPMVSSFLERVVRSRRRADA